MNYISFSSTNNFLYKNKYINSLPEDLFKKAQNISSRAALESNQAKAFALQTKATALFELAADKGYSPASQMAGVRYLKGLGVNVNKARAFSLFVKASEGGNVVATFNVGVCFQQAIGVNRDLDMAYDYFKQAANAGYVRGRHEVARCLLEGQGVARNQSGAVKMFEKLANEGDIPSRMRLAHCYEKGKGVPKNLTTAFGHYLEAAGKGDSVAMNMVGIFYKKGIEVDGKIEVKKNDRLAAVYFHRGAVLRNPYALFNLAQCYKKGRGVEQDQAKYMMFLKFAAEEDHQYAVERLEGMRE